MNLFLACFGATLMVGIIWCIYEIHNINKSLDMVLGRLHIRVNKLEGK